MSEETGSALDVVAEWTTVEIPVGRKKKGQTATRDYKSVEKANNARIWVRAFKNLMKEQDFPETGDCWVALESKLGWTNSAKTAKFDENHPIMKCLLGGTLPPEGPIKVKLLELAEWELTTSTTMELGPNHGSNTEK